MSLVFVILRIFIAVVPKELGIIWGFATVIYAFWIIAHYEELYGDLL